MCAPLPPLGASFQRDFEMSTDEETTCDARETEFVEHSRRITKWLLEARSALAANPETHQEEPPVQRKAA